MPCCLLILVLISPRLVLGLLFFFSRYLNAPYHDNLILLILGFIFLPLTTLVYAWMFHSGLPVAGVNVLWLILSAAIDLGMVGGGYQHHRRSRG